MNKQSGRLRDTQTNMHTVKQTQRVTGEQYNTVQYSTVQYSTVQYSTVQYSTVQYSTIQYSTVQYIQCSRVQYSTVQYSTVQYCEGGGGIVGVRLEPPIYEMNAGEFN